MRSLSLRTLNVLFLAATLICSCATLPLSRTSSNLLSLDSMLDEKAPTLKQVQETTRSSSSNSRTNEFPVNAIDSLERDMRQADSTTRPTAHSTAASPEVASLQTTTVTANSEQDHQEDVEPSGEDSESQLQLRELLRNYYFNPRMGIEKPGNFFVYFDLFRTGPLSPDGDVDRSSYAISKHRGICERIADRLNTNRLTSDICHWQYSCDFNENRFPSSVINASSCFAAPGYQCVQRTQPIMTFTRTFDSNRHATWTKTGDITIVYGYTCRRQ